MIPFRSRAFRWLWSSSLALAVAAGVERTTTTWLALDVGGGAFAVGLVLAARMLPPLLFGLAAGTLADRVDRSRQVLIVSTAAVPVMGTLGLVAATANVQVWQLVALSFAAGCVPVFDGPARQALVMDTVPRDAAPSAMALNALAQRLLTAVGALVAGVLIPVFGVATCYLVVVIAHGLAAGLVALVAVPRSSAVGGARAPFRQAFWEAMRLVVDIPALRTLIGAAVACEVFAFSFTTAVPVVARDVLGTGAEGLGTLVAAVQIGGSVAVVLLSLLPGRMRREPVLGAVFVVYGATFLALASSHSLPVAAAVLVVTGGCAAAFDVLQQTLVQLAVPEERRGRAVGVWVLGLGSAPVGHIEMGLLIAALGAPSALLINGALVLAAASVLLVYAPMYRWTPRLRVTSPGSLGDC